MYRKTLLLALISFALPIFADAAEADKVMNFVASRNKQTSALARDPWEFADVGYQQVNPRRELPHQPKRLRLTGSKSN